MSPNRRGLRCPECDYDLRGQRDYRCPECGLAFDPIALRKAMRSSRYRAHRYGYAVCTLAGLIVLFQALYVVCNAFEDQVLADAPALWDSLRYIRVWCIALGFIGGFINLTAATLVLITGVMYDNDRASAAGGLALLFALIGLVVAWQLALPMGVE